MDKKVVAVIPFITTIVLFITGFISVNLYFEEEERKEIEAYQMNLKSDIQESYSKYVKTNKEVSLYQKDNEEYLPVGKLSKDIELELSPKEDFSYQEEYFLVENFDKQYYIHYQDIEKIEQLSETNQRYKNYIPFNQNIITNDITNFYKEGNLIYTFNKSYNLPVISKTNDSYFVEYNNDYLEIKSTDVKEVIDNNNTDKSNTKNIQVIAYHYIYDPDKESCNQIICHTISQFSSHLQYLVDNNIFTPTMSELERYIDGNLQLPRSVAITVDDGWYTEDSIVPILNKYQKNATVFLVTKWFNNDNFEKSPYLELHSHSYDLHNTGICPGGQGGGIKCLDRDTILNDLKKSREILNNTTYFCYPFYEYNEYSISLLKEAGFTMAFGGWWENGTSRIQVGSNKFKLPRSTISNNTTMEEFINIIRPY